MALEEPPVLPPLRNFPGLAEKSAGTWNINAIGWGNEISPYGEGIRAIGLSVYSNGSEVFIAAQAANASAANAGQSALAASAALAAAQAVSGATRWAAGPYGEGVVVWSPLKGQNYRRRAPGGASATDPANDPAGWFALLLMQSLPTQDVTGNATGGSNIHYMLQPPAVVGVPYTLKFPAAPQPGDMFAMSNFTGRFDCVLDPNGQLLMGVSDTLTLDSPYASGVFKFTTSKGWVLQ